MHHAMRPTTLAAHVCRRGSAGQHLELRRRQRPGNGGLPAHRDQQEQEHGANATNAPSRTLNAARRGQRPRCAF